jgi:hypothetical protein
MLMPVKATDLPRQVRERLDLGHGCTLRCGCCGHTFTDWPVAQTHAHDDHAVIEIQIGLIAK